MVEGWDLRAQGGRGTVQGGSIHKARSMTKQNKKRMVRARSQIRPNHLFFEWYGALPMLPKKITRARAADSKTEPTPTNRSPTAPLIADCLGNVADNEHLLLVVWVSVTFGARLGRLSG